MRKTRPQDYDPNFQQTKGPEPEEIDMGDVVPLKDHSPTSAVSERESQADVRPVRPDPRVRTERDERPVPPLKRQIIRHSFDIYIDQLEALRMLKIEAMRRGEERSLAKMTREALEEYLKTQR